MAPSSGDQTALLLQQISEILYQISVQLSSISPQVPAAQPTPVSGFQPSPIYVRINVFWFTSLAFSLLAALLAILVQQWVRDYMHVFRRYGDPLKSARLRQYLYEGCEGWYMPMVAVVVPGVLHISLFLFLAGLVDWLLQLNIKVALSTLVPISICGLLYIFTIFAPIIYPQSPYQNSFSGIFWYMFQKSRGRTFKDRGFDGEMKPVSTNMANGQLQLAMEETEARKDRDERAIRWLIDNLTEDAEMEKFLLAIPGSFNTDWGTEVWKRVGKSHEGEDQDGPVARSHSDITSHPPSSSWSICRVLRPIIHLVRKPAPLHPPATTHSHPPNAYPHSTPEHIRGDNVVHGLSTRISRFVELYKHHKDFAMGGGLWRKRTHACIEATASLVCCANAKLAWFGDVSKLVGDIGTFERIRELSLNGTDQLFVMRWTCLSLVAIRPILEDDRVHDRVTRAMNWFARADDTGNNDTLTGAQKINETIQKANECLDRLLKALRRTEDLTEDVKDILRGHESQISELEKINIEASHLEWLDSGIFDLQDAINLNSHHILSQIPGLLDDFEHYYQTAIPFSRFVELSRDRRKLQFICPGQTLKSISSPSLTLRNILDSEGQGDAEAYKELLKNLEEFPLSSWHGDVMQRQFWRLQDLLVGGLGFTVELFFLAFSQLSSTSSSEESYSTLYTGTFQVITSDWSKYKHSLGTQKLLLDIAMSRREEFRVKYPAYIVDEFLLLLSNIFEGQTGPHIDQATQQFESFRSDDPRRFRERVLRVLARRAPSRAS